MGRGPIALSAAIVAALLLSACGGDSSDTASAEISKAEFVKKADAVCKKNTERMQRQIIHLLRTKRGIRKPKESEYVKLVDTIIVPNVRREIEELRAIGTPSSDGDTAEAMISALEEGLETAENDPQAVTSSSDVVFGIASRLAGEYGLKVCGTR